VFSFEAMAQRPPERAVMTADAAEWLEMRAARGDVSGPEHHGDVGAWPSEAHAVTAVELYLNCPFKYYASKVLRLGEEVDETPLLSPLARGRFVHEVFQAFFTRWAEAGQAAITPDTLPVAREVFERTVDGLLPRVPAQDRALERARLLGSPASPGMGDRILHLEAGHETPVVERLLEHDLRGTYTLTGASGTRDVGIRGIADRIDLLADGTLRVIDYKTGQPPDLTRALQLPIYAACAEQALAGHRGHDWQVSAAAYVAFGSSKTYVPVIANASERDAALAGGQARFLETIERIGRGEFPPQPAEARLCKTCAFAAVCRKDVRDDD
jgi:RecB family exonuclease